MSYLLEQIYLSFLSTFCTVKFEMAKNPSHSRGEVERLWKEIVGEDLPHEQAIHLPSSKTAKTSTTPTKKKRTMKTNSIGIENLIVKQKITINVLYYLLLKTRIASIRVDRFHTAV